MAQRDGKFFELEKLRLAALNPEQVYGFIAVYIDDCERHAEIKRVSEKTSILDLTPCFDRLEEVVGKLCPWQAAFWCSEIARYKSNMVAPPKISFPSLPAAVGI